MSARAEGAGRKPVSPASDRYVVADARSQDLSEALDNVQFAMVVWDAEGTVLLANQTAARLAGIPVSQLVGRNISEFVLPATSVLESIKDLTTGHMDAYRARRRFVTVDGDVDGCATARVIMVDGVRQGVSFFFPQDDCRGRGRDPVNADREVVNVAVGSIDIEWRIRSISAEVFDLLGLNARDLIGRDLLDMVDADDARALRDLRARGSSTAAAVPRVPMHRADGDAVSVCVLLGACPPSRASVNFALLGNVADAYPDVTSRVAELELRLRRIGSEVRAAGLLDAMDVSPDLSDHPELADLTTRQWEILQRLLRGERVPTIAKELYISRSTVRNHLATIFTKFGVHTQAELLERLRAPVGP